MKHDKKHPIHELCSENWKSQNSKFEGKKEDESARNIDSHSEIDTFQKREEKELIEESNQQSW